MNIKEENNKNQRILSEGFKAHSEGNFLDALKCYQYLLSKEFNDLRIFINYGSILQNLGKQKEAEELLLNAIKIYPDASILRSIIGNIFIQIGKLKEAKINFGIAIELEPLKAINYINMGKVLVKLKKIKEARIYTDKALEIDPDSVETLNLLGVILKELGEYKEAENKFRKAISLKPDFTKSYINLGILLKELFQLKKARNNIEKAIELDPKSIQAFWTLYALSNSLEEAKDSINHCLQIDENFLDAKITLSALKLHQGDKELFEQLTNSIDKNHPLLSSIEWVSTLAKIPKIFFNRAEFFNNAINESKPNRPFYEFGVWRATSFKYLLDTFKKGFGFDTFEGLPDDWHDEKEGSYSAEGVIPEIEGGTFIKGKFEDTLPIFFAKTRPMASIINFDADLYSSTICALNNARSVIDGETILIFDEFITNKNWKEDEYKALNEFCSNNNLSYEVIALSYMTKQVSVKLLGF